MKLYLKHILNKKIVLLFVILLFGLIISIFLLTNNPPDAVETKIVTEDNLNIQDNNELIETTIYKEETSGYNNFDIKQISAGNYSTCYRNTKKEVYCWGQGAYGQLGTKTNYRSKPTKTLVEDALQVAIGGRFGCIRNSNGEVWCWGETDKGQTGMPHTEECGDMTIDSVCQPIPSKNPYLSGITEISAGQDHACAINNKSKVLCWGDNSKNQLGIDGTQSMEPIVIKDIINATAVSAGDYHTCVIDESKVKCWGNNKNKQTGGSDSSINIIPGLAGANEISSGGEHSCAVTSDKTVKCWGYNYFGQLGGGAKRPTRTATPIEVNNLSNVVQLVSGRYHNCALTKDQIVYCWGLNRKGEIGDGTTEDKYIPTRVKNLNEAKYLAAGKWHFCAIVSDSIKCWGDNLGGQLGRDGHNSTANPTPETVIMY